MKKITLYTIVFSFLLLQGCTVTQYKVAGVPYDSPEEALAVFQQIMDKQLESATVSHVKIDGDLIVIIPSKESIAKIEKQFTKRPRGITDQEAKYFSGSIDIKNQYVFNSIKKREIFNRITLVHSDNPESESIQNYDYKLYRYYSIGALAQWHIESKENQKPVLWLTGSESPNVMTDSLLETICSHFGQGC